MELPDKHIPSEYRSDGEVLIPENASAMAYVIRRTGKRVVMHESEHSPLEHGLVFSFVQWLWATYWTKPFPMFANFRYFLSCSIGYCEIGQMLTPDKKWVTTLNALSWSYDKAPHDIFHQLGTMVSEWALKKHGIDLETWKRENPMKAYHRTRKATSPQVQTTKTYKLSDKWKLQLTDNKPGANHG